MCNREECTQATFAMAVQPIARARASVSNILSSTTQIANRNVAAAIVAAYGLDPEQLMREIALALDAASARPAKVRDISPFVSALRRHCQRVGADMSACQTNLAWLMAALALGVIFGASCRIGAAIP
jgi:hypothetical protein